MSTMTSHPRCEFSTPRCAAAHAHPRPAAGVDDDVVLAERAAFLEAAMALLQAVAAGLEVRCSSRSSAAGSSRLLLEPACVPHCSVHQYLLEVSKVQPG